MSIVRHAITKRHISSHAAKPHGSLPPAKMRALISLYHQTETCITPENLSERIDSVFTGAEPLTKAYNPNTQLEDLRLLLKERRVQERFTEDDSIRTFRISPMRSGWDESKALREQRVVDALYGVDAGGKPGLEVLEESAERIQHNLEEDLKRSRYSY